MTSVAVIGGGFAGLSSAIHLAEAGLTVALFESNQHIGGRTRSFTESVTGDTVDNGQHLFMRCYDETLAFLDRIGSSNCIDFQDRLQLSFFGPDNEQSRLACPGWLPGTASIAWGLARLPEVLSSDVLALRGLLNELSELATFDGSVSELLDRHRQSEGIRRRFWTPLCLAALNLEPDAAPARHLVAVLAAAFAAGSGGASLGYANVGLSDLFVQQAVHHLEERGSSVHTGLAISSLRPGQPVHMQTRAGDAPTFDACVLCVPPPALMRLLDGQDLGQATAAVSGAEPSPILSVNLWFEQPLALLADIPFAGLLGTQMQWIFNKPLLYGGNDDASPGYVTLVASAAHQLVGQNDEALVEIALNDLRRVLSPKLPELAHSQVIREHRATYTFPQVPPPSPGRLANGLYVAGDWTDTGFPCTIESAVLSGRLAAEALLHDHS